MGNGSFCTKTVRHIEYLTKEFKLKGAASHIKKQYDAAPFKLA